MVKNKGTGAEGAAGDRFNGRGGGGGNYINNLYYKPGLLGGKK